MKLITPMTDLATGRDVYPVWEYDEARPRRPHATDPRMRFAVKGLVGRFSSLAEAEDHLSPPTPATDDVAASSAHDPRGEVVGNGDT